ncbi:MAG: GDSL-type esterase/lipase family protein [Succiniclasticum sp.]|jgi:lysophospholipase L1-like esterase|nr:GDSL-type esterase/lipase family protein [Succiniclasticum sp.]MEE3480005.1 GDSL-type esterase/lipase family protein [Succiniclasticum sp.]
MYNLFHRKWFHVALAGVVLAGGVALWNVLACTRCRAQAAGQGGTAAAAPVTLMPAPVPISDYPKSDPAGLNLFLRWHKVRDDVAYELRLMQDGKVFFSSQHIYVNGYNVILPADFKGNSFEWQVRALNLDLQPTTEFSQPRRVYVDPKVKPVLYPIPMNGRNLLEDTDLGAKAGLSKKNGAYVPARAKNVPAGPVAPEVYPHHNGTTAINQVYKWIRVNGGEKYEIEVLNSLPTSDAEPAPAEKVIERAYSTHFDLYDPQKQVSTQPMYWRVRALDAQGNPLGVFCPPQQFETNPLKHYTVGTLGDSITHGGGSVSGAPSDWEYDYQSYLKFDTINLGQSGDTSAATLARFDDDVLPFHPEYLIIMTGSNSLRASYSAGSIIDDLDAIRRKCVQNGIKPVFLTIPPINPDNIAKAFNEPTDPSWMSKLAKINAYIRTQPHIELYTKFTENQPLPTSLAIDGLHVGVEGKRLMAEAINEQWDDVLARYYGK